MAVPTVTIMSSSAASMRHHWRCEGVFSFDARWGVVIAADVSGSGGVVGSSALVGCLVVFSGCDGWSDFGTAGGAGLCVLRAMSSCVLSACRSSRSTRFDALVE